MEGPRLPPPPTTTATTIEDDDKPDDPPVWPTTTTTSSHPVKVNDSSSGHWRKRSFNSDPQTEANDSSFGHWRKPSFNSALTLAPPLGQAQELNTYVVQFPKDQIYRVPTPENARIVEQYRNPDKKDQSVCCNRLIWFTIILIILGLVIGAIALVINLVFNPTAPTFTVEKLDVKSPKSPRKTFDITLKAHNLNTNMGISYKESNVVFLAFKNKTMGKGKLPELSQDAKGSDKIHVKLDSSKNAALPDTKRPVTLTLKMDFRAEFSVGAMKLKNKKVVVTCGIKVKGLEAKTAKISSENCESEFKN